MSSACGPTMSLDRSIKVVGMNRSEKSLSPSLLGAKEMEKGQPGWKTGVLEATKDDDLQGISSVRCC